ncbi:MAG: flagellar hook protein FlgE [Gammaproteobacteria bacterium]
MAFRIAVSGLRGAAADLDVTGNNVANSNTTGFKTSRAQFSDIYPVSDFGTVNHAVGQGVKVAAVTQQFSQGNVSFTENNLDLAINGQGFFVLEKPAGDRVYSRAGAFEVDRENFIVNSSGQRLIGFQSNNGNVTGALGPIRLAQSNIEPRATTAIDIGLNLDAGVSVAAVEPFDPERADSYHFSTSTTVYDSLGKEHLASLYLVKSDTTAGQWQVHLRVDDRDANPDTGPLQLQFNESGRLISGAQHTSNFDPENGAAMMTLGFDFSSSTQFGSEFGVNSLQQDGYTTGRLSGLDIDGDGIVTARYTNGQFLAQGQVALANFSNAQGLQPLGDTSWAQTYRSGAPLVGEPGSASLGLVQSGALEDSNVDLAEQLVNMIVAQRNFQANAQMIRAEDEITQTIINIR